MIAADQIHTKNIRESMKTIVAVSLGISLCIQALPCLADNSNGKQLYLSRCAMCHGQTPRVRARWPTRAIHPPRPGDRRVQKRLHDYPGVIVSSVILRPNGDLIPRTLRENGVKVPPHAWTVKDFRDLNEYFSGLVAKK